jgi:outer membrane protein OmpA-like peptidoglycan-associated protein
MRIVLAFLFVFVTSFSFAQKQFEVFFDFSKDIPNEKSLNAFESFLKSNSNIEIISVSGYCDSIDDNSYNKELAMRRINSVIALMKENTVSIKKNLSVTAFGEDFVQSKNQNENRKVVVEYLEKENPNSKAEIVKVVEKDTAAITEDKIETERISLVEKFEKAKIGDRIAIYNINFKFNSETVVETSLPLLEELLFIMERNPKLVIKIHGHICCNPNPYNTKLSYRRALKIFNYLKDNGIPQNRLAYNGVGSNNPIYPIPEKREEERIINRRVEIEIIRNK